MKFALHLGQRRHRNHVESSTFVSTVPVCPIEVASLSQYAENSRRPKIRERRTR